MEEKMKNLPIALLLTGLIFASCHPSPYRDKEVQNTLVRLDQIIKEKDAIAARKEARLNSLRTLCSRVRDTDALCDAYDTLFHEYHRWNVDSAYRYAYRRLELAQASGHAGRMADAGLDLAMLNYISSQYLDAIALMKDIDTMALTSLGRLPEYRYLWYEIYHGLVQTTRQESLRQTYRQTEQTYLDLCLSSITGDCMEFYVTQAKVLIPLGRWDEVIALIRHKLEDPDIPLENRARLHYWIGRAYDAKGDEEQAILHYATSSRYDFSIPLKTYGSTFLLARLCFKRGDINRAYRYITRSYKDAMDMEDVMHINRIARFLPGIISQHEQYAAKNRRTMLWMILSLIALLVALSFAITLLRRNLRSLHKANQENASNARRLQESNHIKDVYLGEFLSMFSEHIDSLERYRSTLRVMSNKMNFEAIQQELRSDDFIDSEWAYLYDKFDKTFLGVFPHFVEEVNALLLADKQVGSDIPKGKLSNELRILALMRLRISEPARISKFLRLSPTTIYNYRVKFRNAARCPREEFEARLMNIGE